MIMTTNKIIGILGGGQLGMMLIESSPEYQYKILDPNPNCSCSKICDELVFGNLKDFETVYNFTKECDIITIEFEHINVAALKKAVQDGKKVYPQPEIIEMIQDKGLQKEFYQQHSFPTSSFKLIDENTVLKNETIPFVQKTRKFGYDGKGVHVVKEKKDLLNTFTTPSIIEDCVDIEKEISVIVARNVSGYIKTFEPVELIFNHDANLVDYVLSPSSLTDIQKEDARKIASELIEKLSMVGILAVEMFLTKSGIILINEIAPRPHNSGHQTIEGNITSQYRQHILAITNQELGDTSITKPSLMLNLLGAPNFTGPTRYHGLKYIENQSEIYFHSYHKQETKPFRKMGHITILGESEENLKETYKELREKVKVIT